MADPYVAEIRMFPFNFAPRGWAECNGQLMPISQNTALFSLVGTTYGGDGKATFGLPNLQGRAPMFWGQGSGLSLRDQGEEGGEQNYTLLVTEIPNHSHNLMAKAGGGQADPSGHIFGVAGTQLPPPSYYADALGSAQTMDPLALASAGSGLPHNNLMPYLTLNFCIALQGVYPPRG